VGRYVAVGRRYDNRRAPPNNNEAGGRLIRRCPHFFVTKSFMRLSPASDLDDEGLQRGRCYGCFRPRGDCFCAVIPTIENQTEVLILQHRRERTHPFNTARIVRKSLQNASLIVDNIDQLAARLSLKPRAGLLYPGPGAPLLADVPVAERPEQLVILDGTWHQTKTMLRDIPALQTLPRYRLAPASPSRYGIRREPSAMLISTLEATIAALRVLEPELRGLEQLMDAFLSMVDRQLAHPKTGYGSRTRLRAKRTFRNIPVSLVGNLTNVVVAYGESASRRSDKDRTPRMPVSWVAQRLGTGERFSCLIQPQFPLQESFLGHLELSREDFSQALSLDEARDAWQAFLRPDDSVAVYNQAVARLLTHLGEPSTPCLVLRSVDFNAQQHYTSLDELLAAEGIDVAPAQHPGRAGKRLANVTAFVRHLNVLGNEAIRREVSDPS
jgi:DTW domain-containing protein YfiP